jgi:phospholipid/cholesterol/gamma-HCH transport system substrate-binding protein
VKFNKEVKVGLLATIALVTVYLGFNFLKGNDIFSSQKSYYTVYDNSNGLSAASPVLVNGMAVGRVKAIQLRSGEEKGVLVTFEIKKDITLTDATKAVLVSKGLLGAKAIKLVIEEGAPLKRHATLPGEVEQGFGEAFAESALPALGDVKDISLLANQFVTNLVENTDKINSIFSNLQATTEQLKQTMHENKKEFNALSQNLAEISHAFADSKEGIRPLLLKLNQLMEGVKGEDAKQAAVKLNSILGSIEAILQKTEGEENNLSKLLYDDTFYNNLNSTLVNLDKVLVDVKEHPWRYVNFSIIGGKRTE